MLCEYCNGIFTSFEKSLHGVLIVDSPPLVGFENYEHELEQWNQRLQLGPRLGHGSR